MTEDHSYDDIIHQPHHVSRKHPRMTLLNRAAQFAPFAALTGYEEMVAESARLTDRRIELDEDTIRQLNERLHVVMEAAGEQPEITVFVFEPDKKKEGGSYRTLTGKVRRIDDVNREIILTDRTVIPIGRICWLECIQLCTGDNENT